MITFVKKITPTPIWRLAKTIFQKLKSARGEMIKWKYRNLGRPYRWLESSKARHRREKEGFFERYCQGEGLDIGYGGDPIVKGCSGWDYEHGDAEYLKGVRDESFDFVYSSHTLEDMVDPVVALRNWWRTLKPQGHLILYIPHRDLYEKKQELPSRWNRGHKHFFLIDADEPPDTIGLTPFIERTLPDSQIVYVKACSEGHTITDPELHSDGEYSIEAVIQKKVLPKN